MSAEDAVLHETLRCIKCQRTITWPITSLYPDACLYCGMPRCYTADRVFPPGQGES